MSAKDTSRSDQAAAMLWLAVIETAADNFSLPKRVPSNLSESKQGASQHGLRVRACVTREAWSSRHLCYGG